MNRANGDVELAKVSGRNIIIRYNCKSRCLHEVCRHRARASDAEKKESNICRRKGDLDCGSCEWDTIAVT
jgi:hypothetical protein